MMSFTNIFSQSLAYLFILLAVFSRVEIFHFNEIQFVISLMDRVVDVVCKILSALLCIAFAPLSKVSWLFIYSGLSILLHSSFCLFFCQQCVLDYNSLK